MKSIFDIIEQVLELHSKADLGNENERKSIAREIADMMAEEYSENKNNYIKVQL